MSLTTPALGATLSGDGVSFAVFSRQAHAVDVCLFDAENPARETTRVRLERDDEDVWRGFVSGIKEGALYGFRAYGPWEPDKGLWFNPRKLLLDPYAKAISGDHNWHPLMQNIAANGTADFRDNGRTALKSVVISDEFDWEGDALLQTPWSDTVVYEMHVRGYTMKHSGVPKKLRGTYAGMAEPAVIEYLKDTGVSAVQLLPVHQHLDDGFLIKRGLTNFWGYNTIGFFAPHSEYAAARDAQSQVIEFKKMVRALHRAGIEVILDVVYNHTAEGDENGPSIFLRGLDNTGYYLTNGDARTLNYTGCGNTVNAASPPALRLIMDSLRYWVEEMHVDGFRFDLAATLGRRGEQFDYFAPFFQAVAQDPILSRVKMIAEPWDMGPNGYQVGGFPKPWRELNGRYRDDARLFWTGSPWATADLAKRFCGSDDIFGPGNRSPLTSLNFLTSHDGFTLRDALSYHDKQNLANGEDNRDGDNQNHSWNCGVEGETKDSAVLALRRKIARSMLATLFCSLGVPFLNAGDERWRTQRGNNNAYCQDNEISWIDWSENAETRAMQSFVKRLALFRKAHPVLRRAQHFDGRIDPVTGKADVSWFDVLGDPMPREMWHTSDTTFFASMINDIGRGNDASAQKTLFFLFNTSPKNIAFALPEGRWSLAFDTAREVSFVDTAVIFEQGKSFPCNARSVACLVLE